MKAPVELESADSAQNQMVTSIPLIPPISTSPMHPPTLMPSVDTARRSLNVRSHLLMLLDIRQQQIEMLMHLDNLKKMEHVCVLLALTRQP